MLGYVQASVVQRRVLTTALPLLCYVRLLDSGLRKKLNRLAVKKAGFRSSLEIGGRRKLDRGGCELADDSIRNGYQDTRVWMQTISGPSMLKVLKVLQTHVHQQGK
jgi:hypothetical protein